MAIAAIICSTACDKEDYYYYIVEGRVIDKATKEPIEDILVSYYRYDNLSSEQKKQKTSPIEYDGRSDADGLFQALDKYSFAQLHFYSYYNGLYKDTIISIDFSNVTLSGTAHKKYKGDYILQIGDIELEKIN